MTELFRDKSLPYFPAVVGRAYLALEQPPQTPSSASLVAPASPDSQTQTNP